MRSRRAGMLNVGAIVAGMMMLLPAAALASDGQSVFTGRWVMDIARSTFWGAPPKSVEVLISDEDGKEIVWQYRMVSADGKVSEEVRRDAYGEFLALPNRRGYAVLTRLDPTSFKRHFVSLNGAVFKDTCTVSDRTQLVCEGSLTTQAGKVIPQKLVLNKTGE